MDQNYDGVDDTGAALHEINRAPFPGAWGRLLWIKALQTAIRSRMSGYSYWDNNSPYLAYVNQKHVANASGGTVGVMLPSYHRPQYLRHSQESRRTNGIPYRHQADGAPAARKNTAPWPPTAW